MELGYTSNGSYEASESEYEEYKNQYSLDEIYYFGNDIKIIFYKQQLFFKLFSDKYK